jgi:hypothetical protein
MLSRKKVLGSLAFLDCTVVSGFASGYCFGFCRLLAWFCSIGVTCSGYRYVTFGILRVHFFLIILIFDLLICYFAGVVSWVLVAAVTDFFWWVIFSRCFGCSSILVSVHVQHRYHPVPQRFSLGKECCSYLPWPQIFVSHHKCLLIVYTYFYNESRPAFFTVYNHIRNNTQKDLLDYQWH